MSLAEIIGCAPFRLAQPRPLTGYEWTVVRGSLESGMMAVGAQVAHPTVQAQVSALLGAIQTQPQCPQWKQSAFGPAPAVAPYAYECMGAWFAQLDPAGQASVLAAIVQQGLLCQPNPPWAGCPHAQVMIGRGARDLWEGAPQLGRLSGGDEACAPMRQRTSYTPMKGQEMLDLFRAVGGQVPTELAQAVALGSQFTQRDFLIGIQLKPGSPELSQAIIQATDMRQAARLAIEEMAVIWAPNRGASVLFLLDDVVNPYQVAALIQMMAPDLAAELIPQLSQALPQLLPWIFGQGTSQQLVHRSFAQPQTPPTTGIRVLDTVGTKLPKTDLPVGTAMSAEEPKKYDRGLVTAAIVGAAALSLVAVALWKTT